MPSQLSIPESQSLEAYYTDMEESLDLFRSLVATLMPSKRILVIHGIGGVGKSSLLRMFRLYCKSARVPVALVSGDDTKSVVEVLRDWAQDLKDDGVVLPTFVKTYDHFRTMLAKAENQAGQAAGKLVKDATKTITETVLSTIPGIGPILGKLGGTSAEALVDWLRGQGFAKSDVDLILDPAKRLTDDFLADVNKAASQRRLVLMLDTFEQMTTLNNWTCDVARRVHPNALLVIAGRDMVNWDKQWDGWLAHIEVHPLEPMTSDVMRTLVRRYYATMVGGEPDPKQVEAIIAFARGLPMVVTTAVRLWVKYRQDFDIEEHRAEVYGETVKRLREGVPSQMTPLLEAAAAVRWFDKAILRAVTGLADVNADYDELRRFPFVTSSKQGLRLHDSVREILDESLRVDDRERHRELHERAVAYFEAQMTKRAPEEVELYALERLYHRTRADEETGMKLFQETAEELVRYRFINRLRVLLNDANTYPLEVESRGLWREYYNARVAQLEMRLIDAETTYQAIAKNEHVESKLRAYSLCDWGEILSRYERLAQPNGIEKANSVLEQSIHLVPLDFHLAHSFVYLARVQEYLFGSDELTSLHAKAKEFFEQYEDKTGLAYVLIEMKKELGSRGLWRDLFDIQKELEDLLKRLPETPALKCTALWRWTWGEVLAGRLFDSEQKYIKSITLSRSLNDSFSLLSALRDLGWTLGCQGRYDEANQKFAESLEIVERLGQDYIQDFGTGIGFWGAVLTKQGKFDQATEYLLKALHIKQQIGDHRGILEQLVWLGRLYEIQQELDKARDYYNRSLETRFCRRSYFDDDALTSLVRVAYTCGDYSGVQPIIIKAEALAQQYEYNDHLASLNLTQGHIAWNLQLTLEENDNESRFETVLSYYKKALIYALRYNRFLLDEVLWGGDVATPLHPVIANCLEKGKDGRRMLTALRDWWQSDYNCIGAGRPDTISHIPENIYLLEAERIARKREVGDGSSQQTVVDRINEALDTTFNN